MDGPKSEGGGHRVSLYISIDLDDLRRTIEEFFSNSKYFSSSTHSNFTMKFRSCHQLQNRTVTSIYTVQCAYMTG
jgi:hypothetical protein